MSDEYLPLPHAPSCWSSTNRHLTVSPRAAAVSDSDRGRCGPDVFMTEFGPDPHFLNRGPQSWRRTGSTTVKRLLADPVQVHQHGSCFFLVVVPASNHSCLITVTSTSQSVFMSLNTFIPQSSPSLSPWTCCYRYRPVPTQQSCRQCSSCTSYGLDCYHIVRALCCQESGDTIRFRKLNVTIYSYTPT